MTLGPITHLTIHCAATPEGRDVPPATIEAWDRAKFGQVSYHWIVDIHGNKHRSLGDDVLGCHTHLHNHGNIGVCYVGGCDLHMNAKDTRTDAQKATLLEIVREYQAAHRDIVVQGHRDWPDVHKDCPSFDVRAWLKGAA
jgi:N-acetylmuramoyl-L-alanine amidase